MKIASVQVKGYKGFKNTGKIELDPNWNLVVGKNNTGKTALLEALEGHILEDLRHRSESTVPTRTAPDPAAPLVELELTTDTVTVASLMRRHNRNQWVLPSPQGVTGASALPAVRNYFDKLNQGGTPFSAKYRVRVQNEGWQSANGERLIPTRLGTLDSYAPARPGPFDPNGQNQAQRVVLENPEGTPTIRSTGNGRLLDLPESRLGDEYYYRAYRFLAERFKISRSQIGVSTSLMPDGANLPGVLNLLSSANPARFEKYVQTVRRVLSDIRWITSSPVGPTEAEIRIWTIGKDTERDDLAIPLKDCGTGVGQVLAILYVVLMAEQPSVLIIDEPQSFLHPSAARELIEVLKEHSQHQYIVATHSPEVITAALPAAVIRLTRSGATVSADVTPASASALRDLWTDLGVRLSDVYGADEILWVEGTTEEACFPHILENSQAGTKRAIVGVRSTGRLRDGRRKTIAEVMDIYRRLSETNALLPPAVGFVFDREGLSERDIEDLEREATVPLVFTPVPMFEDYLLNPEAIATVLNNEDSGAAQQHTGAEVQRAVAEATQDSGCQLEVRGERGDPSDYVPHAAKVLDLVFRTLTEARVSYRKAHHGLLLTEWLVDNDPRAFSSLVEAVEHSLPATPTGAEASTAD